VKNAVIKRLSLFAITVAMAALPMGAVIAVASPASAAPSVRGLDLQQSACDTQWPGSVIVLTAHNVYGWRCRGIFGFYYSINMNAACRWTYGPHSSAYYLNFSDPYSWRCT
jgi:hypothetical protein